MSSIAAVLETRRKARLLAGVLLLGLCLSAGCRSGAQLLTPARALPGSSWRLIAMDGHVVEHYLLPKLQFDAEDISGDTGCNRYFASLELEGDTIQLGPIGMTRRACEPSVMDREARYLALLATAKRVEVRSDFLMIECAGADAPLRFRREE